MMANTGRWEFEQNIGTGGFGVVKLFVNTSSGVKIVIKECRLLQLSQDIIERWHVEMEILKRLDHHNIVRALNLPRGLDPLAVGDTPCICMEYCDGGDLRQILRDAENCCGLEEIQVRQICRDVTQGIRFLHSQKIIHRDLKPENILLKRTGENQVIYKLTDFGYAKQYDQSSVCTSLVGTVQYVAPEVLKDKTYHSSVDFWSFGVIVFECVTGRRPFLHGHPSRNFAWVEFVAKKGDKDIHIYWGENDEDEPVYSSHLPQPHRLSRPFESLLTSWLQHALHYNPQLRGSRAVVSEEAPCLSAMEHHLNTWIVSALCMQTGDVHSYTVSNTNSVENLKVEIQCTTTVAASELYLALPDGHILGNTEHMSCCVTEGSTGMVYIFSTSLEPSFKMMPTSSPSINQLIVDGDDSIPREDRREVYSHAFFHIREQYHLFERLHKGHRAILNTIHRLCVQVKEEEQSLRAAHLCLDSITSYVESMLQADVEHLQKIYAQKRSPRVAQVLESWKALTLELQEHVKSLSSLNVELSKMHQEMDTLIRLAEDLRTARDSNERDFYAYYQQYVIVARKIYQDAKINNGVSSIGRMADVLLGAKQQAEKIIMERLNGYNFAQQYIALETLLNELTQKKEGVLSLRREVMELGDRKRNDVWMLLEEESYKAINPFHSLPPGQYENWHPLNHSSSSEGGNALPHQFSSDSDSGTAAVVRQTSRWSQRTDSSDSVDEMSIKNDQLTQSLRRVTRLVSVQENEKLAEENKSILGRLISLVETYHKVPEASNGTVIAMETSYDASDEPTIKSYTPTSFPPSVGFSPAPHLTPSSSHFPAPPPLS